MDEISDTVSSELLGGALADVGSLVLILLELSATVHFFVRFDLLWALQSFADILICTGQFQLNYILVGNPFFF